MARPGETPTNDYDARIIVDIKDDSFIVSHTGNIDLDQVYMIFVAAIEYMEQEEFGFDPSKPRVLN
jgi:hypothetical protein